MCLFLSNSPCRFADANAGANCFAAGNFYSVLLASSLLQAIFTACCWLHLCCLSLFACWLLIAGRLPAVASSHSVLIAQAASLLPMRCGCCLTLKLVLMMLVILLVSLRCLVAVPAVAFEPLCAHCTGAAHPPQPPRQRHALVRPVYYY